MTIAAVALALASVSPIVSIDDVLDRLEAGVSATALTARIETEAFYLELTPRRAVSLHAAGVPIDLLAAIFATHGGGAPELAVHGGQLELRYDAYRILGSMGRDGPVLQISGYDRGGARLKPAVEPAPEPTPSQAAVAVTAAAGVDVDVASDPGLGDEPIRVEININPPEPAPVVVADHTHTAYGVAPYVTVSRVPPSLIAGRALVHPYDAPAFGFGYYGYGTPFYNAYAPHAPRYPTGHVYYHDGYGHSFGHGYLFAYGGYGHRKHGHHRRHGHGGDHGGGYRNHGSKGIWTYAGRGVR